MLIREIAHWLGLLAAVVCLAGCEWQETTRTALAETEGSASDGSHKHPANRLARETSPYLLLHAHNPVDWYPWGPEAFEKARKENKPIFLSVGYSSCYWCHVMERLSFSDAAIAKYMNEHFVNIKVDREERPDVDDIYMTSCIVYFQAIGSPQGGGWPLSMFLTPEGKPFAGGTYFPPRSENGRPGFEGVLKQIHDAWTQQPESIEANASLLTREVQRAMKPRLALKKTELARELVDAVVKSLVDSFDSEYGGVDFNPERPDAPKFPVPAKLSLLQYQARRHGDDAVAQILDQTLDRIARGGIRDHLGGGFHRYSTDREWLVPHFEKMLYDQAQLADVYIEAFRQTGNRAYRRAATETLDFVLRDMRDAAEGNPATQQAFHSAIDAETDQVEGKYYVWSMDEIDELLEDDADLFKRAYGVAEPSRFEHGFVLHLPRKLTELGAELNLDSTSLEVRLDESRSRLLAARAKRPAPLKDDKILTSWNGLMIRALANAGSALNRQDYLDAAEGAALFILSRMRDAEGHLLRTHRADQSRLNAYLDDYAFLVQGLLALHEATRDVRWLNAARKLTDDQIKLFWDETNGAFFFTMHHHEELIARTRNAYDAVLPAGNSVSVRNLLRLASLTGNAAYRDYARKTLEVFSNELESTPRGLTNMALALAEYLDDPDFRTGLLPPAETRSGVIQAGGPNSIETEPDLESPAFVGPADEPPPFSEARTIELTAGVDDSPGNRLADPTVQNEPKPADQYLKARAYLEFDRVPTDRPCRIAVVVDIADKWHINTNPAQPDYLVPTEISGSTRLQNEIDSWQFPPGKVLEVEGIDETFRIYEKQVVIFGVVRAKPATAGKVDELMIEISYQACNDARCLKPTLYKLGGRVPVARRGEQVKSINAKIFRLAPR